MFDPVSVPVDPRPSVEVARAELARALWLVRRAAADARGVVAADLMASSLRAADQLTAVAVDVAGRGGFAAGMGMPARKTIELDGRRTQWESHALSKAAQTLTGMPLTKEAFEDGRLSWSQVREISIQVRFCTPTQRTEVDQLIERRTASPTWLCEAPEQIILEVDELVKRLRPDLTQAREDRAFASRCMVIQPSLDGSSGKFWGRGDAESIAMLAEAIDAKAAAPQTARIPTLSRASRSVSTR